MDDVKRYNCTNGKARFCYGCYEMTEDSDGNYVQSSDFDAALAREAALREELATAKRNEHNSEVAYKAAIEKQEELRVERNELDLRASRLKVDNENYDRLLVRKSNQCDAVQQRLTAAEQRNAELVLLLKRAEPLVRRHEFQRAIDVADEMQAAFKKVKELNQ